MGDYDKDLAIAQRCPPHSALDGLTYSGYLPNLVQTASMGNPTSFRTRTWTY